jgi:hypothetical protein
MAKPILQSEFLASVEALAVDLEASVVVIGMDTLSPAGSQFLSHAPPGKAQPGPIDPNAVLVFAGQPDHYGCGIHDLAKTLIEAAWKLSRKVVGLLIEHLLLRGGR